MTTARALKEVFTIPLIKIDHLTKDYGDGRGIFDVNLSVEKGECFGFVGVNGAGKTTVIRHLMGFIQSDNGNAFVGTLNCWSDAAKIQRSVGYVPGEIAFPDAPTGTVFLKQQAELLGLTDMSYADTLIKKLQLDPTATLKRMSKGMKQKTAIVAAFMADPDILILDEPTTGLDPLMRMGFVDLLCEEKAKGKTIFMSSHMFNEVEDTCDRVAMIKEGRIVSVTSTEDIRHHQQKTYKIEFPTEADYTRFLKEPLLFVEKRPGNHQVIVNVHDSKINDLMKRLSTYGVKFITEIKYTLEKYFQSFY